MTDTHPASTDTLELRRLIRDAFIEGRVASTTTTGAQDQADAESYAAERDLSPLLDRLEAAEGRALKLAGYAAHDDDCTVNRYPEHEACSCGLRLILQENRHAG